MRKRLGVALDVGTTTVQGSLIDLDKDKRLSHCACLNEQVSLGSDIISRIKFSIEKPGGLKKAHEKIISSINLIIKNLLSAAKEEDNIIRIIAVGNSVMYHFLLSLSPEKLVEPPYEPVYKGFAKKRAAGLGINVNRDCELYLLPNVGGFVGSDAIAVILATDMDICPSPILALDIGTNGEILLGSKKRIYAASAAAGPAFEGWHVSCGMGARDGSIESIKERDGKLRFKIIGGSTPKGLAGSGLIDIIAILLKRGYIDAKGGMKRDFVIYGRRKKISVTRNDVRQVQLAKAAFAVGIKSLRKISTEEPQSLFITGRFGGCLNKDNARVVGLIPGDIAPKRVAFLENGALRGAEIFIKDPPAITKRIDDILAKTEHISLAQDKDFQKEFAAAMGF